MRKSARVFVSALVLFSGQVALANPQADAILIAQRAQTPDWLETVQQTLGDALVDAYFAPIAGNGIEIADRDRFRALIPEEIVARYVEFLEQRSVDTALEVYTPEQLATIAAVLRADPDATPAEIFAEDYQQRHEAALIEARSNAVASGSDDPLVLELEEVAVRMNALSAMLEDGGGEALGQDLAFGIASLFSMAAVANQLAQSEVEADNPVTFAAINERGVLRFANPTHRQTLLRQIAPSTSGGGIQFVRPLIGSAGSN
ncbi:hypothetical protein [Gymnodinialimonas hymeniacidonis]|uniref:hypothetical protein n=1 Tax=Gymnodinialimonas hymeniacidonis TaxID=3126508 RepID=UPI0034C6C39D